MSGLGPRPGTIDRIQASPQEHLALAKHLTAESKVEEFVAGRGVIVRWERVRKQNHWFDTMYNACAAGYFCGARLGAAAQVATVPQPARPHVRHHFQRADGRPWIDAEACRERMARYLTR
jgi:hypothetical protein